MAALRSTALGNLGAGAELEQARPESIQVGERHLSLNRDDALTWSRVANDLILSGQPDRGVEYAERAYSISPESCRYNVACAFARAGKLDRALDLLEIHARKGAVPLDWLEHDNDWDKVRETPRFDEIRKTAMKKQTSTADRKS